MHHWKVSRVGIVVLAAISTHWYLVSPQGAKRGPMIETWQTSADDLRIRITAYKEEGVYLPGTYYVFESTAMGTDRFTEFMVFRHDDRPGIPRDQVRFVDKAVCYVFMGWIYAVTTDGGAKWSTWNAKEDLPGWRCCNYRLISRIEMSTTGEGSMKLNPITGRPGESAELRTQDFGRRWTIR